MKKRNIIISAVFAVLFSFASLSTAYAQIYVMIDDDDHLRPNGGSGDAGWGITFEDPEHNTTSDYSPLGSGVLLLGGLAGAYLLNKRRKTDTE